MTPMGKTRTPERSRFPSGRCHAAQRREHSLSRVGERYSESEAVGDGRRGRAGLRYDTAQEHTVALQRPDLVLESVPTPGWENRLTWEASGLTVACVPGQTEV